MWFWGAIVYFLGVAICHFAGAKIIELMYDLEYDPDKQDRWILYLYIYTWPIIVPIYVFGDLFFKTRMYLHKLLLDVAAGFVSAGRKRRVKCGD